ncbi:MAG: hypothetical protein ACLQPH_07765 [Acidimicrobiales bacterium]
MYVTAVSALAALGDTRSAPPLLAGVLLTLPLGLAAFVGVYGIYAILLGVARIFGAHVMTGNGWGPHWFVILDEILVTLMFAIVAFTDALLVRQIAGR